MHGATRWDRARRFALSLPLAAEDRPWGDTAIKIKRKDGVPTWRKTGEGVWGPMFVWLGKRDVEVPSIAVKLVGSYDAAIALAGATPTTMSGLGQWGWLTVPLAKGDDDLVELWIEESYRTVAPKRIARLLDEVR